MTKFEYVAPSTLQDCMEALESNPGAMVFAGGTDVLVKIRNGALKPGALVDIKHLNRLRGIRQDDDGTVRIGSLTTHTEVADSPIIQEKYPFFSDASRWVGSHQIRNRGTIGGNICNGSPAAETLTPLYVLEAKLHLESREGKRVIPVSNFCCGPQKTCAKKGEILTEIEIPPIEGSYDGIYLRYARRNAVDIAMVTCCAFRYEDNTTPTGFRYRIAMGSVAPTVVRATTGEEFLNKAAYCGDDLIEEAALTALSDISPIDDIRTTCDYRRDISFILIKRAIGELVCRKGASL